MTAVSGIGAGLSGISSQPIAKPTLDGSAGATGGAGAPSFQGGLDAVSKAISASDQASVQVATGTATDLHQVTVAATKAQLGVSLTVAMRNRAVEAYQEIMRMSV